MSIQRVIRKDGTVRYVARVYVGDVHRGRAFPTRKAAKVWEGQTIDARARGTYIAPESGRTTLREHSEQWLSSLHLRPATMALYRSHLTARILPVLGDMHIGRIKRPHVQRVVAGLKLAPATTRTCYAILAMVLKDAVESELIPSTPCRNISLPPKKPRPVRPLSPAEVERVISEMPARYQIAGWVSVCAGLRLSEVLGLEVAKIDFLRRVIRVEWQLGRGGQLAELKTPSSRRAIPADDFLLLKISEHLRRWPSDGLLVTSKVRKPVQRSVFEACWRKAAQRVGLEGVLFHDLRKTYGSILVRAGLNVLVVRDRLGHKDAALTLSTYAGLWPEDDETGRGVLGAAFAETSARDPARDQEHPGTLAAQSVPKRQ